MTRDAHGRVFRPHPRRVKARPVWIEPEAAAHRGMTRGAVTLGVARGARFKTLPRCLSVSEAEIAKCVVVAFLADSRCRDESRLLVAALTELRRVVAVAAICVSCVCRARVTRKKVLRVIAGQPRGNRAVTFEAHGSLVASLASPGARARLRAMPLPEILRMTRRF